MFSLATWNVNSIRVRLEQVVEWLKLHRPTVLALQELKMVEDAFPLDTFNTLGYQVVVSGQATYNGVAILSLQPLEDVVQGIPGYEDAQKRVVAATINGIRVICVYVPNGASVDSDKYAYKLHWFEQLIAYVKKTMLIYPQTVILGDYNIAPEDRDVHNPALWQGQVLVSAKERACFASLLALGLKDTFRALAPEDNAYTWWDYRMNAFKRNLGLRIDHILATTEVMARAKCCVIDKVPRTWERPSDHTPVILQLNE